VTFRSNDMQNKLSLTFRNSPRLLLAFAACACLCPFATGQNSELQQRVAALKEGMAHDRQELAKYTWIETDTISLKGVQKNQDHFQVRLGPDGKAQKSPMDQPQAASSAGGGREGRLKKRVIEKKKEEYKDYAERIKTLIQRYVPPQKEMLQQAAHQGNIALGPTGAPGTFQLVLSNYVKRGDRMTLIFDKAQKNLANVSIATYLDDPKDAVNVTVEFARIPDGPNHVASQTINGVSKQLTIAVQNSNYQRF
jgi:DNA-binding ferritin-like protein (Dps family)